VQTTLLGLAVTIILALVTALVGPLFVDWGRYRASFEAEATRLVGMPVRVAGRIDARLLPTPSLLLNDIEIGAPGHEPKLRTRSLGVEFALGPLLRGEWRVAQLHLDRPEVALGIDAAGRIDAPQASIGFDPDQLSFERVVVENGRAVLSDAASGGRLVLDQLSFKGDIRSLLGPFKGEGAFVSSGQLYGYHVAGSRRADDGGMRLRLSVDPSDRPLAIETDGSLWVERDGPRYEGSFVLARPAGMVLSSGRTVANEPWRATSRIKATSAAVLFEQLDIQYGPEDRAIKLAGTANLKFGSKPRFEGVLSARQVDLDRTLVVPDAPRRSPVALLRTMTDTLSDLGPLPLPVKIGIGIDNLTLGSAPLTSIRGDILSDDAAWSLDSFEFRAPGATQVRASGRLRLGPRSPEFNGPADVDSADPKALIAWLEGRPDVARGTIGSLHARGEVTLGAERLAVDRLEATFDRKAVEGRLLYAFATEQRPARLDAAITAAEFDLDGALASLSNAIAGTTFDRPGEVALALDFGRTTYAGVEAKGVVANLKFDSSGLVIERLALADFGGAMLSGSGRIDTSSPSPRGSIALTLEAQRLNGIAALATKFALPRVADVLQSLTQRPSSTKLTAKLDVLPAGGSATEKTSAKLVVDGLLAGLRVNVAAEASGDAAAPGAADIRVEGRVDGDDGSSLATLVGLDRLATIEPRPARLVLSAAGPANGDLRLAAKFSGVGIDAAASGGMRFAAGAASGAFDVTFSAADARLLHRDPSIAVPVTLATHVAIDGDKLTLDRLTGKIAGSAVKGRLALVAGQPTRIDGRIEVDALDPTAVIAVVLGAPPAPRGSSWSAEPFLRGPFADLQGDIEFAVARASFGAGIAGRQLRGIARVEPSSLAFDDVEGTLGEGRMTALAKFRNTPSGLTADARLSLANANLSALMPRNALGQVSGQLTLELAVKGSGLSPAALIGGLSGTGTATVDSLQISGFDPKAIESAVRAADRRVPLDVVRIGDVVRTALDAGRLNVPAVSGAITIEDGRAALAPAAAPAEGADVALGGTFDLRADDLNLRFGLIGARSADAPGGQRPEISITLKGPFGAVRRTVEVSSLVNWLAMRAVDQEAKRLEVAEQEAKRIQAEEARRLAAEKARRAEAAEEARRAQESGAPAFTSGTQALEKLPELPAAIEIKPLPGKIETKPRRPVARAARVPTLPTQPAAASVPLIITPPDPRQ
jgi:uncharacterized protein involved in outer membrane biogenesis